MVFLDATVRSPNLSSPAPIARSSLSMVLQGLLQLAKAPAATAAVGFGLSLGAASTTPGGLLV